MHPLMPRPKINHGRLGIGRLRRYQSVFGIGAVLTVSVPFIFAYLGYGSRVSPFYPLLGVIAAVLVQLFNSYSQRVGQAEEFAMRGSAELLEEGYVLLKDGVESGKGNRLSWLTAARNIIASAGMIGEIQDQTKKAIALEKEMLYRLRYKALLWPLDDDGERLPADFYAESSEDYRSFIRSATKRDPIAIASIVEIYRFASWPPGRKDPLPLDQKFTKKEVENMIFFGPRALGELMRKALYPSDPDLMYHVDDNDD